LEAAMRRVRYSVAMSVDGYIAGPDGQHDWIVMDPEIDFRALMGSFDTILMGRKTYEASRGHKGGGMPGISAYVFSRTLKQEDCPGVVVSSDPRATIGEIKTKPGKDLWLFGGGGLFRSMLDEGLVDSVEVSIVPVVLGAGVKFLPEPYAARKLKLVTQRVYAKTGTVALTYAVA
jgi:dihydrofolate reductase